MGSVQPPVANALTIATPSETTSAVTTRATSASVGEKPRLARPAGGWLVLAFVLTLETASLWGCPRVDQCLTCSSPPFCPRVRRPEPAAPEGAERPWRRRAGGM